MLKELVSEMGLTFFPIASLVLFVAVFLSVLLWTLARYDRRLTTSMAAAPLQDAPVAEDAQSEGQN
ncbi:MAG: hypothetical protein AAFX05_04630 [Planctomycetota bacterium]